MKTVDRRVYQNYIDNTEVVVVARQNSIVQLQ